MPNIDLTKISKDELFKMWEVANNTTSELTTIDKDEFDLYVEWLENNDFGSEIMHFLALEIVSHMYYAFRYGITVVEYRDEFDEYDEVTIPVDRNNPDTKAIVEWCISALKGDIELLKQYGITTSKKATKKMPYLYSEIDWSVFNKF